MLSSRNGSRKFVLSNRNSGIPFVLSSRNGAGEWMSRANQTAGQGRLRSAPSPATDQAGPSVASLPNSARRVMTTLAAADRRPALRGPSSTTAAGASSISAMS